MWFINKGIEVDLQMNQILELVDKYLEIIINNMFKIIEEKMDSIDGGMVNFSII